MLIIFLYSCKKEEGLILYIGAASQPPIEEILVLFEKETQIKTKPIFGGSGYIFSQMKLAQKGDIFFPGSSDFMEIAKRENLIFEETEKRVVYLVPTLNVQIGNPKGIQTLYDLLKPNLKIAIANPENVCVEIYIGIRPHDIRVIK
ncbi:MAG: substrate-binding domain-containing protein [Leptospiraceae bacterium]|nr:substrate-binding domain-containing protein [Leptospiraceae bacterium]